MGIKHFIQNRQLASVKLFEQGGRWRPGENSLRMVGLIVCVNSDADLSLLQKVRTFFMEKGAVCRVCIYQKSKKMVIPEAWMHEDVLWLNQKSANWLGLLRSGCAEAFLADPFDLLINLSEGFFFTTTYLASIANATLKVGRYVCRFSPYRIVLDGGQSLDDDAFIRLLDSTLQIIKFK